MPGEATEELTPIPEYVAPIMADTPAEASLYADRETAYETFRAYTRRLAALETTTGSQHGAPFVSILGDDPMWTVIDIGGHATIADPPTGAGRFQFTVGVPAGGLHEYLTDARDHIWITHSYETGAPIATKRLLTGLDDNCGTLDLHVAKVVIEDRYRKRPVMTVAEGIAEHRSISDAAARISDRVQQQHDEWSAGRLLEQRRGGSAVTGDPVLPVLDRVIQTLHRELTVDLTSLRLGSLYEVAGDHRQNRSIVEAAIRSLSPRRVAAITSLGVWWMAG